MLRRTPRIAIVGGGVGGLACAVELACSGCEVVLFERASRTGGKMRTTAVAGRTIDAGPTVLTMRWVFDELFARARLAFADIVPLERAEILARHAWTDGTRLDLHADAERSAAAIGDVFGRREREAYLAYHADGRRIYEAVLEPFLRSQRPTLGTIVRRAGATSSLVRIDAFRTLASALAARFAEPKLRQLFGRYATYCGSSPYEAPATLSLVAYVEASGVYRVRGGMLALGEALASVARAKGVQIVTNAHVERITASGGRATGVVVDGVHHPADAVVFNGDVAALATGLLGDGARRAVKRTPPSSRSLSAVTLAIVGRTRGLPLVHHNVFFGDDYAAEMRALVRDRRLPEAPTVYACAQDRGDDALDLESERLLLVLNAPPTGDDPRAWPESEIRRCEETTFTTMKRCGLEIDVRAAQRTTPLDFAQAFEATGGAIYGPSARGPFSALSREGARSRIPGLYLAGGSVHPGPGVPMAALSGRLAAAQLLADLTSTSPSLAVDMRGTTSTE